MSYIERESVMQAFTDYVWNSNHSDLVPAPQWNHAVEIVRDFPAADVVEVDSVIPFVRVCDRKEYIKNSEKLINEYLAELLERFGVRCLAQIDNINGTVKFWAEKMDGGADDAAD